MKKQIARITELTTRVTVNLPKLLIDEIDSIALANFDTRTQTVKNLLITALKQEKLRESVTTGLKELEKERKRTEK